MPSQRTRRTQGKRKRVPKRKSSGKPRQPGRRAIPGSVFVVKWLHRASSRPWLNKLEQLRREGKLHLSWRLPETVRQNLGLGEFEHGRHWLGPATLPSTPQHSIHHRSILARIETNFGRRKVKGYVVFKGAGSGTNWLAAGHGLGVHVPFAWMPTRDLEPQRFHGAERYSFAMRQMDVAEKFRRAFAKMRKTDPLIREVSVPPTYEPVGMFESLQMPVEYRGLDPETHDKDATILRESLVSKLSEKEKRAFEFVERRRRSKRVPNEPETVRLKVANKGRFLSVPENILGEQAELAYFLRSKYRIGGMVSFGTLALVGMPYNKEYVYCFSEPERYSMMVPGQKIERHIDLMSELFESYGFELRKVGERSKSVSQFEVWKRTEGGLRRVSNHEARLEILDKFVKRMAAATRVMHRGVKGTFSHIVEVEGERKIVSSMTPSNVTIAGEVVDLDTVSWRGEIEEKELGECQWHDKLIGANTIEAFMKKIFPSEIADQERFITSTKRKYLELVDGKMKGLYSK